MAMLHMKGNAMQNQDDGVFFSADSLEIKPAYVSFVDIMGMVATMEGSLKKAANFMGRFHAVLLGIGKAVSGLK